MIAITALVVAACFVVFPMWKRLNSPAERERRRRLVVNANGRTTDGTVTDISGDAAHGECLIHYRYVVGGVECSAAQDVSSLRDTIGDLRQFLGTATVKYSPRSPANSIIVCEEWTGLRSSTGTRPEAPDPVSPVPNL